MLDNGMTAPRPRLRDAGQCEQCGANFSVARKTHPEDFPFKRTACSAPGCLNDLCDHCEENGHAFVCEGCGKRFCNEHKRMVCGEPYCDSCEVTALRSALKSVEDEKQQAQRDAAGRQAQLALIREVARGMDLFYAYDPDVAGRCARAIGTILAITVGRMDASEVARHRQWLIDRATGKVAA